MRYLPFFAFALVLPTLAIAAQSAQNATPQAIPQTSTAGLRAHDLSVRDVIALVQGKVDDSVIVAKLRQANAPMNLSTDDLLALKQAGVSDAVVRTMIAPGSGPVVLAAPPGGGPLIIENATEEHLRGLNPTGATAAYGVDTSSSMNNPLAAHDSGIYLATHGPGGAEQLHFMDRAVISGVSEDNLGLAMLTFTAVPLVFRYQIAQGRAPARTSESLPVFYFYFEDKAAALGKYGFSAANVSAPTQFALVHLAGNKKKRQLFDEAAGISVGVRTNVSHTIPFTSERLSSGMYRVTMKAPLKAGEYAFVGPTPRGQAGNPTDASRLKPDIFDFGVDTQ